LHKLLSVLSLVGTWQERLAGMPVAYLFLLSTSHFLLA